MTTDPAGRGPQAHRTAQDAPLPQQGLPEEEPDARPHVGSRRALYCRLLGLRHLQLRAWHRALFAEGALAVAVLLVLADLATAWTLLVLPLAVAALVKLHDVVAGLLAPRTDADPASGDRRSPSPAVRSR